MRNFLIIIVLIGFGVFYYKQKHGETPAAPTAKPANSPSAVMQPQLTPAPPGQASEHNWMKRSLDRARDVTQQSREQTKQNQEP